MTSQRTLPAVQAAAELHVSLPTLYAYVSRGLIRSEPAGPSERSRRYLAEDIAQLKSQGVREIFTPGATTDEIVAWVHANVRPRPD